MVSLIHGKLNIVLTLYPTLLLLSTVQTFSPSGIKRVKLCVLLYSMSVGQSATMVQMTFSVSTEAFTAISVGQ